MAERSLLSEAIIIKKVVRCKNLCPFNTFHSEHSYCQVTHGEGLTCRLISSVGRSGTPGGDRDVLRRINVTGNYIAGQVRNKMNAGFCCDRLQLLKELIMKKYCGVTQMEINNETKRSCICATDFNGLLFNKAQCGVIYLPDNLLNPFNTITHQSLRFIADERKMDFFFPAALP